MKKKMIALMITLTILSFVGCSNSKDEDVKNLSSNSVESEELENEKEKVVERTEQDKLFMKKYEKSLEPVRNSFLNVGIVFRNMTEDLIDKDFISRIIYEAPKGDKNSLSKAWFGLTYNDENNVEELALYMECITEYFDEVSSKNYEQVIMDIVNSLTNVPLKNGVVKTDLNGVITGILNGDIKEKKTLNYDEFSIEVIPRDKDFTLKVVIL